VVNEAVAGKKLNEAYQLLLASKWSADRAWRTTSTLTFG
jgi:hypothetical protein